MSRRAALKCDFAESGDPRNSLRRDSRRKQDFYNQIRRRQYLRMRMFLRIVAEPSREPERPVMRLQMKRFLRLPDYGCRYLLSFNP